MKILEIGPETAENGPKQRQKAFSDVSSADACSFTVERADASDSLARTDAPDSLARTDLPHSLARTNASLPLRTHAHKKTSTVTHAHPNIPNCSVPFRTSTVCPSARARAHQLSTSLHASRLTPLSPPRAACQQACLRTEWELCLASGADPLTFGNSRTSGTLQSPGRASMSAGGTSGMRASSGLHWK